MPMAKLTLSADRTLIRDAKKLAADEGTSLSSLISRQLSAMIAFRRGKHKEIPIGPITRRATGLAKVPAGKSYRELIEEALIDRYLK